MQPSVVVKREIFEIILTHDKLKIAMLNDVDELRCQEQCLELRLDLIWKWHLIL